MIHPNIYKNIRIKTFINKQYLYSYMISELLLVSSFGGVVVGFGIAMGILVYQSNKLNK